MSDDFQEAASADQDWQKFLQELDDMYEFRLGKHSDVQGDEGLDWNC